MKSIALSLVLALTVNRAAAQEETESEEAVRSVQTATFAAGCFWGVQSAFDEIAGVLATFVGYTGGTAEQPSYRQVCTGRTGHAEAVLVEFDPETVSFEQLLGHFWELHDPTTKNRQGPDVGTQYRSAIFYHSAEQKAAAEGTRDSLNASGRFRRPIVTEIAEASTFWPAEEYHQKYFQKHGGRSCHIR